MIDQRTDLNVREWISETGRTLRDADDETKAIEDFGIYLIDRERRRGCAALQHPRVVAFGLGLARVYCGRRGVSACPSQIGWGVAWWGPAGSPAVPVSDCVLACLCLYVRFTTIPVNNDATQWQTFSRSAEANTAATSAYFIQTAHPACMGC